MTTEIITIIESAGFKKYEIATKNSITIFVDGNRKQAQQTLLTLIPDSILEPHCYQSSIGRIVVNRVKIYIKPNNKKNGESAHSMNEILLYEQIKRITNINTDPITVVIRSNDHKITIDGVTDCIHSASDTSNRKKADVVLTKVDGTSYGISLKMDNAGHWESPDRYYRSKAATILTYLRDRGHISLTTDDRGITKISPTVAIEATEQEISDMTFGNDLLGSGCIVVRTLTESDFHFDHNTRVLTITSTVCADSPKNEGISNNVWFLLRNDSSRPDSIIPGIRGLRVTSINRTCRNSKQLLVNKEWLEVILDSKKPEQ